MMQNKHIRHCTYFFILSIREIKRNHVELARRFQDGINVRSVDHAHEVDSSSRN